MKSSNRMAILAALIVTIIGPVAARAAIIGSYVDADPGPGGNTVLTSNPSDDGTGTWLGFGASQWNNRTATAPEELGDILENGSDASNSAPEITTTITGLNSGSVYNIYIIYQTVNTTPGGAALPTNTDWHVNAGLTASPLTRYDSSNGAYTGLSNGNVNEREGLVGQVSGVSSASVFVDDDLNPAGTDLRSRYDGLAFEFVGPVPEPSSLAILGIGALIGARRRARR